VGVKAGDSVRFPDDAGRLRVAVIPEAHVPLQPGDTFSVLVDGDTVMQALNVMVPSVNGQVPECVRVEGVDGQLRKADVPRGLVPGQIFCAMVPIPQGCPEAPMGDPLDEEAMRPWIEAAQEFRMNTDFNVVGIDDVPRCDLSALMYAMKVSSEGKMTIQALGDKIILSRMFDNLNIPQMPLLLVVQDAAQVRPAVEKFVDEHLLGSSGLNYILKPTHLSNGEGVAFQQRITAKDRDWTVDHIGKHLHTFLEKRASEHESLALQSLQPGFIAQVKYQSAVAFHMPLELRVISLWGRVRVGVWWWGDLAPQRNAWIVRKSEDAWEALHEHDGQNPGFEAALNLFQLHMPKMAATTEHLSHAVGAPFLRADFFVGNEEFGVRLNEVAYGSGVEYRRRGGEGSLVNDGAVIAQILQEGSKHCVSRLPPEAFLGRLGVRGRRYGEASVEALTSTQRVPLPPLALREERDELSRRAVPPELCMTMTGPVDYSPSPCGRDVFTHSPRRANSCVGGGWFLEVFPNWVANHLTGNGPTEGL